MGRYLLGLDAGNTVIKAVIFDREGNRLRRGRGTQPDALAGPCRARP